MSIIFAPAKRQKTGGFDMQSIAGILFSLGLHPRYKGYGYIVYVLTKVVESDVLACPTITIKQSLSELESIYSSHQCAIKRSISFALHKACESECTEMMSALFPNSVRGYPPTTTEFLSVMSVYCLSHIHNSEHQKKDA